MRRGFRWVTIVVLVWLIIGVIAAWQRGYFTQTTQSCTSSGAEHVPPDPVGLSSPSPHRTRGTIRPIHPQG